MTPIETIEAFVADWSIDTENVTIAAETTDGTTVRYLLSVDSEAPREEIEAFYRMQGAEPIYTDGERTWVYADHVDDLPGAVEE